MPKLFAALAFIATAIAVALGIQNAGLRREVANPSPAAIESATVLLRAETATAAKDLQRELGVSAEVAFSPGDAEQLVLRTLASAKASIRLAAYSFTSPAVAKALVDAHRRGVDVRVILDRSNETGRYSGLTYLRNAGIPVTLITRYAIMHNKFAVIDGAVVQTGSFNYTSAAATRNAENVVVLRDPKAAAAFSAEWERLAAEASAR